MQFEGIVYATILSLPHQMAHTAGGQDESAPKAQPEALEYVKQAMATKKKKKFVKASYFTSTCGGWMLNKKWHIQHIMLMRHEGRRKMPRPEILTHIKLVRT